MRIRFAFLLLGVLACEEPARAGPAVPADRSHPLAPIPAKDAASTHGPYGAGACAPCHQSDDPNSPGPAVNASSNDLCTDCHEEFKDKEAVRMDRSVHPRVADRCLACHNPHNSRKKKLRL